MKKPISVCFLEEGTNRLVATWRMPLDKLPETFVAHTRLNMGNKYYLVAAAEPATRAKAAEVRQVTIVIREAPAP